MTTQTLPTGSDIQAEVARIATQNSGRPFANTLSAVANYFTTEVFTAEQVRPAKAAIEAAIAADIISQIKTVGENVSDFTLPDADGHSVTLATLLGGGPVVVVFYRGEWCPYCNLHLARFQQHLDEIKAFGATLVAVSPQSPDHSSNVQNNNSLGFPVLSDIGSHVAQQFGVAYREPAEMAELHDAFGINLADFNGGDGEMLPIPATFVLRQDGTIAWVNADFDYTKRSEPKDVLAVLSQLS